MFKSLVSFFILFVVTLLSAADVPAQPPITLTPAEQGWLQAHPVIRLNTVPDWAPISMRGADGNLSGITGDFKRSIETTGSLHFSLQSEKPWDQVLDDLSNGNLDAVMPLGQTPQRDKYMLFTDVLVEVSYVILTRSGNDDIRTLSDLAGKRVSVRQNFVSHEWLAATHPEIFLFPKKTNSEVIIAVSSGEVDAFVGSLAAESYEISKYGLTGLKIAGEAGYTNSLRIGVRKDWPELVGIINKSLAAMSPQEHKDVWNKWVKLDSAPSGIKPGYLEWMAALVVLTIILILAVYQLRLKSAYKAVDQKELERAAALKQLGTLKLQERYGAVLSLMPDGFMIVDQESGSIFEVNDAYCRMSGYSRQEILSMTIKDLNANPPTETQKLLERVRRDGTMKIETQHRRKDGKVWDVDLTVLYIREKGLGFAVQRDITERKKMEQAVKEALEFNRALFEKSPVGMMVYGPDGRCLLANKAMEAIVGGSVEQLSAPNFREIAAWKASGLLEQAEKALSENRTITIRTRMVTSFGRDFWVEAIFSPLEWGGGRHLVHMATDVTARKEAEDLMHNAKEAAEAATKLKDKFVSLVAHDLRAPVNVILGFTKMVHADALGSRLGESQRKMLEHVISSAQQMNQLIDDVLNLSRLKTGAVRLNMEFFDANQIGNKLFTEHYFAANEKGITLTNAIPERTRVYSDKILFGEVAKNFLSNAIKFCGKGDVVTISAKTGVNTTICVKDTGPGLEPAVKEKLLRHEAFRPSEGSSGEKGSGYGLMLVSEMLEALGGKMGVVSEPGRGAEFCASIPFVRPRIMIVDDNPHFRIMLTQFLKPVDAEIVEAGDGESAMRKIEDAATRPHLIISDVEMPGMTGLELLKRLQDGPVTKSIPVIIMSGKHGMEIRDKVYGLGAVDFLTKEIKLDDFIPRIRRYVG